MALQGRYAQLAADDPKRPRLRAQLISGYLPVAEHLARRFAGRGQAQDDLIQVATLGLINAVDRFDPARGGIRCHLMHQAWQLLLPSPDATVPLMPQHQKLRVLRS